MRQRYRRMGEWLIAIIIVAGPPYFLLNNWWMSPGLDPRLPEICIVLGLVLLTGYLGFTFWQSRTDPEFQDLWFEIRFAKSHAPSALIIGGSIACIITGVHLLWPITPTHALYERYETSIATYVTVVSAALGVKLFYRRIAPITDANYLLERLIEDIAKCEEGGVLWAVFPALNIGYYRNRKNAGSALPPDHVCQKFKSAVGDCAARLKSRAHAITYPIELYQGMYEQYHAMNNQKEVLQFDHSDAALVTDCVNDAIESIQEFKGGVIPRGIHHELTPNEFPPQVFIIGNVTYMILSYGIPIYEPNSLNPDDPKTRQFNGRFVKIEGKHEHATVLAYRREDPAVAKAISRHLELLVKTINHATNPALDANIINGKTTLSQELKP